MTAPRPTTPPPPPDAAAAPPPSTSALGRRLRDETRALRGIPLRARFLLGLARLLPDFALNAVRTRLLRAAGFTVGPQASFLGRLHLIGEGDVTRRLAVGEGAVIAPNVTFGLDAPITLGRNVSISPAVTLYTATHAIGFGSRRMSPAVTPKPIVVEDGVWIGMRALILPGVTLGHGCVVSAGSVVLSDVPANALVAGNPATVQQMLPFGNR